MKECRKCEEIKELTEFSPSQVKAAWGICRLCQKKISTEYYLLNKERIKISVKTYVKNNREKVKISRAEHRRKNKERIDAENKKWVENNREKSNAAKKKWLLNNLEKRKEVANKWVRNNPGKANAQTAKRRTQKLKATPTWLTEEQTKEIQEFYKLAKELQWLSQEPLHVDHIIPIVGKNVCGLHVPWNLQILPKSINIKKGNKY